MRIWTTLALLAAIVCGVTATASAYQSCTTNCYGNGAYRTCTRSCF